MILIIPAYNEEATLPGVLAQVAAAELGLEVVVVDDGSADGTAACAAAHGARVIRHPFNLGYGAALQTGYKYAFDRQACILVQMDADGQHDPAQIPRLAAPLESGELDLVLGSRFLEPSGYAMTPLQTLGRRFFGRLGRRVGLQITDPTSGFQAMNRATLALYVRTFFPPDYPDLDVLVAALRHGLRIGERAVTMRASPRRSTLHGGLRVIYYVYKMLLSIWAVSRSERDGGQSHD